MLGGRKRSGKLCAHSAPGGSPGRRAPGTHRGPGDAEEAPAGGSPSRRPHPPPRLPFISVGNSRADGLTFVGRSKLLRRREGRSEPERGERPLCFPAAGGHRSDRRGGRRPDSAAPGPATPALPGAPALPRPALRVHVRAGLRADPRGWPPGTPRGPRLRPLRGPGAGLGEC